MTPIRFQTDCNCVFAWKYYYILDLNTVNEALSQIIRRKIEIVLFDRVFKFKYREFDILYEFS